MPLLPSSRWPAPSQRLRVKTTVVQVAVVGADPGAESDPTKGREVYLVSFYKPWLFAQGVGNQIMQEANPGHNLT